MKYEAKAKVKGIEYTVVFDYTGPAQGFYRKACDELTQHICSSLGSYLNSITTEIFQTLTYTKLDEEL